MTRPLSEQEHAELAAAIRAAEARTTGEIYCVAARQSDSYFYPAAFMLAAGVLIASLPVAIVLDRSWLAVSATAFVAAQVAAFAACLAVTWLVPSLRIHLVPLGLRYRRAHDNAVKQFLAHNVHLTAERTGILIFVSLAERYAEVVADGGISASVSQEEWDGIIAELTDKAARGRLFEGLMSSIARAGTLLAGHFPGAGGNPNELEDHVVEI